MAKKTALELRVEMLETELYKVKDLLEKVLSEKVPSVEVVKRGSLI